MLVTPDALTPQDNRSHYATEAAQQPSEAHFGYSHFTDEEIEA